MRACVRDEGRVHQHLRHEERGRGGVELGHAEHFHGGHVLGRGHELGAQVDLRSMHKGYLFFVVG